MPGDSVGREEDSSAPADGAPGSDDVPSQSDVQHAAETHEEDADETEMRRSYRVLRRFMSGNAIAALGDSIQVSSLQAVCLLLGIPGLAGVVQGSASTVNVIFSPLISAAVDSVDNRKLIAAGRAISAVAASAICVLGFVVGLPAGSIVAIGQVVAATGVLLANQASGNVERFMAERIGKVQEMQRLAEARVHTANTGGRPAGPPLAQVAPWLPISLNAVSDAYVMWTVWRDRKHLPRGEMKKSLVREKLRICGTACRGCGASRCCGSSRRRSVSATRPPPCSGCGRWWRCCMPRGG